MAAIEVHFHAKQTQYHMKGFVQRLVLKQRHKLTGKQPIEQLCLAPNTNKCKIICTLLKPVYISYQKFCCVASQSIFTSCAIGPVGRVKIQTTSKNSQRYHTTKRLIRDLLSNTRNWYVRTSEFRGYLFTGNARQKYAKRNRIGAGNQAN